MTETIIPIGDIGDMTNSRDERARVEGQDQSARPMRRPPWIKVRAPSGETYERVRDMMRSKTLHTVCEEAKCPNIGECWGHGTATFLMMGDTCTRSCGFCDIKTGRPSPLDWQEPIRIADAVRSMNLRHVVITSVNRDERPDGGAPIFAMVIRDLATLKVDILTVGQYLQPSNKHLPIDRYYEPQEFDELKRVALELGFKWAECGPLVRSSYRAEAQVRELSKLNYIHMHHEATV